MIEYPPLLNIAPKPRTPPVNNNSQHQPPQQMVEHPHISPTPFRPGNSATTSTTNPTLLLPMFNKQSLQIPDKSSTRDSEWHQIRRCHVFILSLLLKTRIVTVVLEDLECSNSSSWRNCSNFHLIFIWWIMSCCGWGKSPSNINNMILVDYF